MIHKDQRSRVTLDNNNAGRTVQAEKRNVCQHNPNTNHNLQHRKGGKHAATDSRSQAGLTDASYITGGRNKSAFSNSRKSRHGVYDPWLGKHPIPTVNVPDLLEQIVADTNFDEALMKVNSEPRKAVGCDRKTVREVCVPLLNNPEDREKVRQRILRGKYVPHEVRITEIPKANGKKRKLGIATVLDRVVQNMILLAVTKNTPEDTWSKYSYAYRKNRRVADAIAEVDKIRAEGYKFGIMLDLKAFFDNVPHDRLITKLRRHIVDQRVATLIYRFLTPVMRDKKGNVVRNRVGSPQGSVISPWLASMLYMDELDREMESRGLRFVRYADDITVFCHSKHAARRVKARLIDYIETTLKCPVNRDKTRIEQINKVSLLGVCLKRGKWRIQREKLKAHCGEYLGSLNMANKTGDEAYLVEAIDRMRGFLNHYKGIPDIAANEVPQLKKWCWRRWISVLGKTGYERRNLFRL